ncbi:metallophosphoesterase family protein [Desulfovibrio sp. OttesenSCG-928-F07]|nr:metallophosphoesterase family protein [Desulfovibrio sp. OttesenSCG-928-F07]
MPSSAYWIAYGDIHSSSARLEGITELKDAAGTIISGDLTFAGGSAAAEKVLKVCNGYNKVLAAQIGNMDMPEVTDFLQQNGINLHASAIAIHPQITLIGIGGSNPTPFNTPSEFSEAEYAILLEKALKAAGEYTNLVLVSHAPPLNTKCDVLSNGAHAGSSAVRNFIEQVQPQLCICGHIHEAQSVDKIGKTTIINPGTLSDGGYIKFYLANDGIQAELLTAV